MYCCNSDFYFAALPSITQFDAVQSILYRVLVSDISFSTALKQLHPIFRRTIDTRDCVGKIPPALSRSSPEILYGRTFNAISIYRRRTRHKTYVRETDDVTGHGGKARRVQQLLAVRSLRILPTEFNLNHLCNGELPLVYIEPSIQTNPFSSAHVNSGYTHSVSS